MGFRAAGFSTTDDALWVFEEIQLRDMPMIQAFFLQEEDTAV